MKIYFSILLIAFSIIISSEVVGIVFIYESKVSLENQILNDSEAKNRMLVNRIDTYISERTIDILNIANDRSVVQTLVSSNIEFQKMDNPRQYIETQNVTWSSTPPGQTIPLMSNIVENPTADRLRVMMNMEKAIFQNDVFGRMLLANSYGADVAASIKPDDYDQLTDPWFVAAKQNGLYVGDVTQDKASGFVGIPISARINDENGNFIGVAKAVVSVNNIFRILANQIGSQKTAPIEYLLFDNKGTLLYSSDKTEKPFVDVLPDNFMQNIKGQSGSFSYQESDEPTHVIVYVSSNSSKITPTGNWILATEYDPAQILQSVQNLTNYMIALMLIIVPIASIAVFVMSSKVEKPLSKMASTIRGFPMGNIKHVSFDGSDEVKELTASFNKMIETITKSEADLIQSENLFHTLFDNMPLAAQLHNENEIITTVNNQFLTLFGLQRDEIVGKPFSTISADKNLDIKHRESMEHSREELTKPTKVKWLLKRKDGTTLLGLVHTQSLYNTKNEFMGHMSVIEDITQSEEFCNNLEKNLKTLETEHLQLTQIDQQKDEFSSMISHELTTPLFPIKFHAAMLKDPKNFGTLNKDQLNSVNEIYQNSIKLEKLVSDVLDTQKLEMKVMKFVKNDFKLDEFMHKVFTDNLPLMANKQIKFVNSTTDKITITSDPDRLSQVFSNLIINSVDFVPDNAGIIEINAKGEGNNVLFYVKDNGIGIPKDKQKHLFKKFYQIDTSVTRKHRGSGLGLSICKGIVEGLDGKIWFDSAEGVGTVVYFAIPKN